MVDRLKECADLKDGCRWETLVVGNGLSINIWRDFAYSRLFEQATLDHAARRLFSDFDTQNFETVREALWHAERTLTAFSSVRAWSIWSYAYAASKRRLNPFSAGTAQFT
jgi:hypothetical protein